VSCDGDGEKSRKVIYRKRTPLKQEFAVRIENVKMHDTMGLSQAVNLVSG